MEAKVEKVLELLTVVCEDLKSSLTYSGLDDVSEAINERIKEGPLITRDYLYKKLYTPALKKAPNETIGLIEDYLNKIARFAGYKSYLDFEKSEHKPLDPKLKSCEGTWYSFVRCNSGQDDILMSPVKIWEESRKMRMVLKGPSRAFKGELRKKEQNLFAFLETEDAKELHLVFKIGIASNPEVIQGVFSGISSTGDPIAGKEVLVRVADKSFEELKNERISIKEAAESSDQKLRLLAKSFKDYEKNSLKVIGGSTFRLSDLDM